MPDMVNWQLNHNLVAIKSKLFVVAEKGFCEVFDKVNKKFTVLQTSLSSFGRGFRWGATSIGNKIAVYSHADRKVVFYDADEDTWYEEPFKKLGGIFKRFFIKLPVV